MTAIPQRNLEQNHRSSLTKPVSPQEHLQLELQRILTRILEREIARCFGGLAKP